MLTTILKKPIITEKSTQKSSQGKFVFKVDSQANKNQIRQAVESTFKVTVLGINTLALPGKSRRTGKKRLLSTSPRWKKAIVKLKSGDKIKVFDLPENK